jgi:hypothetical protein
VSNIAFGGSQPASSALDLQTVVKTAATKLAAAA